MITKTRWPIRHCLITVLVLAMALPAPGMAQGGMDHAAHQRAMAGQPAAPTLPGQDAYGAIAEIVRILEADSTTDWSKVDLERLRQHLIDMNELTLRSSVTQRAVEGGLQMEITGQGRTVDAIRGMTAAHGRQLASLGMDARAEPIPGGARFTVVARDRNDVRLVAKIRGLGFIGLMTTGDHHAAHHLAMARGAGAAAHVGH